MTTTQFRIPHFRWLGYLTWLALLLFSLVFYKERTLFLDAGFQMFNMVNEEAIQIYHYRFVAALPQFLPFFALKLGASLKIILLLNSIAHLLFFALIYHLMVRNFKNDFFGWALTFLFTLLALDSFYHIQSEFYHGLGLLLLLFAIVTRHPRLEAKWSIPVAVLLMITIAFAHKLTSVFFLFLWLFFFFHDPVYRNKRYLLLLGLMLVIVFIKAQFFTNWYEAIKQADFQRNWTAYFPNFQKMPANKIFLQRMLRFYYFLPILWAVVGGFYLRKRKWLKLGLVFSFSFGYILLINIAGPNAPYRFYSEVSYLPLSIFVTVPLMFDLIPTMGKPKWVLWIFATIILLRLVAIASNHQTFENRLTWMQNQLAKAPELGTNRLLLKKEDAPMDTLIMEWGLPYSTMLLSSLVHPDSAKTLFINDDFEKFQDYLDKDNYFLSIFKKIEVEDFLNPNYFKLEKGKYILLEKK